MQNFEWNFQSKLVYGAGRVNEVGQVAKGFIH